MPVTERTQSLADFRQKVAETVDRINQTGEPEIITVDGAARAVLLSPAAYDELAQEAQRSRDVAAIKRSLKQYEAGESKEVNKFFGELRDQLLTMKGHAKRGAT